MKDSKIKLNKAWSTHMPILIKLVQMTNGVVVELGAGLFSTPILHWLCSEDRRPLWSYEDVEKYYKFTKTFQSRNHHVRLVKDWEDIAPRRCSVLLIDHITKRRMRDAIKWKDHADYIILHDSSHEKHYNYDKVYPHFKYVYHWKFAKPWTSVVSNFKDLSNL